jgi:DNA-directed RNA polymerase specialized sigma24 family protein
MMSKEQFEQLAQKLDTLIRLVAGNLLKGTESKTERVEILYGLGISTKEIAQLVGTTEGSIDTMKKRIRKRAKADKDKPIGGKKSGEN